MDEFIYYNNLFDYYGELLTDVQVNYFKAYYCDNLSLGEIADEYSVSRNAVSKCLKDVKDKLDYYEGVLKLYNNNVKIKNIVSDDVFNSIIDYI